MLEMLLPQKIITRVCTLHVVQANEELLYEYAPDLKKKRQTSGQSGYEPLTENIHVICLCFVWTFPIQMYIAHMTDSGRFMAALNAIAVCWSAIKDYSRHLASTMPNYCRRQMTGNCNKNE